MNTIQTGYMDSPLGCISITASEKGITLVTLGANNAIAEVYDNTYISLAIHQLQEYFEGQRKNFDWQYDLNATPFQLRVWQELEKLPFGKTISYHELAIRLGDEKVIRAAAAANGKNPIAIVIPCHRVIGKDGSLIGYAGGLWRKKWLLEHENTSKNLQLNFDE